MKIGPKFKIARRLGARIFPKTQTTKFSISGTEQKGKKSSGKSSHRARTISEYGLQLIEKQKVRYAYGLKERQLATYVKTIRRRTKINPITELFKFLEWRLDNVVYRSGLATSRAFARQLVTHGHILVNGRRLNVPSHQLKTDDVVSVRPASQTSGAFKNLPEYLKQYHGPAWLAFDPKLMTAKVKGEPIMGETDLDVNYGSILEFYSRV